ncbi:MAG: hypothetical protein EPN79_11070 [Burkholderiaceae bacterium]|nr:MAG: hypothetical protein EPN79_11070 [Burkholderiaceae bacterium]TBR76775.1 MAG: hypothetical protein EPN64_06005 [Burkholderiaceae bacterium]
MPAIYATLLGTGVSLAAHRKVMKFFEISLDEDGPRTQRIYHAAITALIVGLVGSAVAFWLGAATGEQGF